MISNLIVGPQSEEDVFCEEDAMALATVTVMTMVI